jgi:hypothetical protein
MDLFDAFNIKKNTKTLDANALRKMIMSEAKRIIHEEANRLKGRSVLSEHTIPDDGADLNDMDSGAVWDIMTGGDDEAAGALIAAIASSRSWGPGAMKKGGIVDAASLKAKAEEIWDSKEQFGSRVGEINTALSKGQGFAKPEMPALEGDDVDAVADALGEPGDLNIDIGSDFGGDDEDFERYYDEKEGKERATNESFRNWMTIDPRFPFEGPGTVMKGAPNVGEKGDIDTKAITGKAKAFLTKGKGNAGDDLSVTPNQSMTGADMKPTQTNVKAAKTMLFALLDIGADMEGAYASSDGDILDGHHRWSGQYLRTGGAGSHTGVHIIDKGGMDTKEFLTMLTVLGNALGRPTKTK